jgi:hypothetical protein
MFIASSATKMGLAMPMRALTKASTAGTAEQHRPASDELREDFQNPPKRFRPLVRWWWPGDDVTDDELRREIAALDDAAFGGAEIQAFYKGLNSDTLSHEELQKINGFASYSFFRHVSSAAAEAHDRGLFIDYTFGSGWPFGGGDAISPELAAIELR